MAFNNRDPNRTFAAWLMYANDAGEVSAHGNRTDGCFRENMNVRWRWQCSPAIYFALCIRPRCENKGEWSDIRSAIVSASDKPYEKAFRSLVEIMSRTVPRRDNKEKWRAIRQASNDIVTEMRQMF